MPYWPVLLLLFCLLSSAYATTPAGTVIKNQASASYRDGDGVVRYATSNIVETLIQQVAALQLAQDQSKPVVPGRQVYFSHTLTNSGNGPDVFDLTAINITGGDSIDLASLSIYADTNQDGQPDVFSTLTQTPSLSMQESWSFVVAGQVPSAALPGDTANIVINAVSQFNNTVTTTNTDSVTVLDGAVVEVDKSISAISGDSPDGPFTVSLNYRNIGTQQATDVTLLDALPAGMTYVAGSGRWNGTGGTILTDTGTSDLQGGTDTIRYCAYDVSCTGVAEAISDVDSDSTNQVTAIITSVPAGSSGVLSFDVVIAPGLNASTLLNTAELEYTANGSLSQRILSNRVAFTVLHTPSVVLNGSASDATDLVDEPVVVAAIAQATLVNFSNTVWNTGNGTDTFDITIDKIAATFPTGSVFRILQSDGMTPLLDSNGNGIPDTGPLAAAASYNLFIQVIPPSASIGDNAGAGYEVTTSAVSVTDSSVTNSALNRLLNITTAAIDITNIAAITDTAATGVGPGPEANPVTTVAAAPGSVATLGLYINNVGQTAVAVDLDVSEVADFSSVTLPAGWVVEFRIDGDNANTTNSGIINPGEHVLVNAFISIPADAVQADVSLYFRALSDLTGALDIKHELISVSLLETALLEPDQTGQTGAGGTAIYHHSLQNTGNVAISNLSVATTDIVSGWSSIVYEDANNNGQLDAADPVVNTIANLAAGEVRSLIVKVFAPSSAPALTENQTIVTATWNAGANSLQATDSTTIAEMEISIVKEQAPDYGCTGATDAAYGVVGFAVEPGNNCVSYRLTATNAGQATAFNVEVADATPAFTEYFGSAVCSQASCTVAEPATGGQGNVIASVPSLSAGDVVTLSFSVRVQ